MSAVTPAARRPSAPEVAEVAPGVFLLDLDFQGVPGVIAAYLVADGDELALVETGPTSTAETLLAGVRAAGFEPERITRLVVTHIHLDHAGAAGWLLRRMPGARLFVHPNGARHLADPSKLMASAARIYGDRMDALWGEMVPVPADRLTVLHDGDVVRVGGRSLRAIDTPGHASHHLAFHDEAGLLFTGDAACVRLGGTPHVRPATPPPDLDLERWLESLVRLRALGARRLCLTHFGAYDDADAHLDRCIAQLFGWAGFAEAHLASGADAARVAAELARKGDAEIAAAGAAELTAAYELATSYRMNVDGLVRYFAKRAEQAPRGGGVSP